MKSSPILTGVAKWANRYGGYLLAAALSWGAATVRFLMTKQLENQSRMLLFIPVVMISAWYGGVGPGIFAILAGGILTAWVLIPPVDSLNIGSGPDQMEMLVYLFIGIGIVYLVHMERAEKKVREAAQAELEASNRSLEDRVKARTHELEVANRELEGFCYNVSHDLRTPTRSIIGNARILLDDFGGELSPPIRTKLERISSSAAKLGDFVDALLVYARLAKADLKKEVVCLNDILQTEAELNERHTGKRTTVKLDSQILIYGDRKLIEAAVEAVVSNTSKYAKPDAAPVIRVKRRRTGNDLIVSFEDDGIGFDPQYVEKVFEPFERLHRDDEFPGVGMGLANVARIASRHNGSAWAISKPGHGATVFMNFGDQPESMRSPGDN